MTIYLFYLFVGIIWLGSVVFYMNEGEVAE